MKKIFAIFLLIFLIGCTKISGKDYGKILINNGKEIIKINIEIADDSDEMAKGLMFRESLDGNSGMLFVFDGEDYRTFWMKNTLIPLDMVFIDKNLRIVGITYAIPCEQEPCSLYKSSKPAQYVLEVNSNFTPKKNIKKGDDVIVSLVK